MESESHHKLLVALVVGIHTHTCTHMYVHTHIHICTHTYTHTHTHTHTRTHTHTHNIADENYFKKPVEHWYALTNKRQSGHIRLMCL